MGKLYICRGLPASGKTRWARELLTYQSRTTRVNRDDLRAMAHNGRFSAVNEYVIRRMAESMVAQALMSGHSAISDDTNLQTHVLNTWMTLAEIARAQVVLVMFETPLEVCIERNSRRPDPVPEAVIRQMHATMEPLPLDLQGIPTTIVYPGQFDWSAL